jgi:hypothetical protein
MERVYDQLLVGKELTCSAVAGDTTVGMNRFGAVDRMRIEAAFRAGRRHRMDRRPIRRTLLLLRARRVPGDSRRGDPETVDAGSASARSMQDLQQQFKGGNIMSSVIDFLERMGADASLRCAGQDEIAQAVADADLDAELGAAIIAKSTSELYAKLNMTPMFCVQTVPRKEGEEEEEEQEEEQVEEPQKDKKTPSKNAGASSIVAHHATTLA